MWRFIVRTLAVFGFLFLLLLVFGGVGAFTAFRSFQAAPTVEPGSVLIADWRGGIVEKESSFFASELGRSADLPTVVRALHHAAADPNIDALLVRADGQGIGLAAAQELRTAVEAVRAAGKKAVFWSDTLGDFGGGNVATYLASGFDRVTIQALGTVGLTGIQLSTPFVKDLLDKLQLDFEVERRESYKTALDFLVNEGPSPEQEAQQQRLADALFAQIVDAIAQGRDLSDAQVNDAIAAGPLLAGEAITRGLIDGVGTFDDARADAGLSEDDKPSIGLSDYVAAVRGQQDETEATVAFVHAVGNIVRGRNDNPLNSSVIAGDTFAAALEDAREDGVDAVVLRVSSPGGSALASETIAEQVRALKADGIPVIVSMGGLAASGGYWISMDADTILAQPATLTGSIGVVSAKPTTRAFFEWLGIDWASVEAGANADLLSTLDPYSPMARARLNAFLDAIYGQFIDGVSKGRGMSAEAVQAVAQGQVWTGKEALANGLVDRFGGIQAAIDLAAERAELGADTPFDVRIYPQPGDPFDLILAKLGIGLGWLDGVAQFMSLASTDGTVQAVAPIWSQTTP